jgi:hypothetical protein
LGIAGEISSSETGVKRYTTYRYSTEHASGLLKEGVLLELGSRGGTQPAALHPYRSMVAEYAISVLGDAGDEWEEFEPFNVLTLAPERTLLEKLAGVHAMATAGDLDRLRLAGRHFYDIHQLLGDEGTREALASLGWDGVAALAADIDEHSRAAGFRRPRARTAGTPTAQRSQPMGKSRPRSRRATGLWLGSSTERCLNWMQCADALRKLEGWCNRAGRRVRPQRGSRG